MSYRAAHHHGIRSNRPGSWSAGHAKFEAPWSVGFSYYQSYLALRLQHSGTYHPNILPLEPSAQRHDILTKNATQSESVLIQKIYTHFKKAPGTHKLGVLYVVDSVTRKWLEQAKSQGQTVNSSAQDGTYAAGVHRVTELMPVLMNDILQSCPEEQKVRNF